MNYLYKWSLLRTFFDGGGDRRYGVAKHREGWADDGRGVQPSGEQHDAIVDPDDVTYCTVRTTSFDTPLVPHALVARRRTK